MKLKPLQSKYIISIQQPHLWALSGLVILGIVFMVTWSAYEYGRYVAGFDKTEYDSEIEILRQSLDEQTAAKEKALRENARLSRGSDIQKDASSKLSDSLSTCEDEMLKVKEELTFYHNIVSPKQSAQELKINKVQVSASPNGSFNYKVVLIQTGRHDYVQRGYVEIYFEGKSIQGKRIRLDLSEISLTNVVKQQRFGFKYFQNFEGGIRFPEGFQPLSMFVKAVPTNANVPRLEQVYDWGELIAGGNESNVGQE